jgi:hypothetical protein
MRAAVLALAFAACLPALAAQPMLKLKATSTKGRVLVTAQYENRGAAAVRVPRALAAEKELTGRLFDIVEADTGAAIEYQGMMVKRGPLTDADYLSLKPGAKRSNTIDITRSYAFLPGPHRYLLSYAGAAPVAFTHAAK